jgi:hypothetical protein
MLGLKMNKHKAKKTTLLGIDFQSMKEAKRYNELLLLLKAGEISNLRLQVPFELAPSVKFDGEPRKKPALRYLADFVYNDKNGNQIVEDAKGFDKKHGKWREDGAFRIKRHLMATVHGIQIKLT